MKRFILIFSLLTSAAFAAEATKTEVIAVGALLREKAAIEEAEATLEKRKEAWQAAHAAIISDVIVRLNLKPGTKLDFSNGEWKVR